MSLVKEVEAHSSEVERENFNLKMRLYHLQQKFDSDVARAGLPSIALNQEKAWDAGADAMLWLSEKEREQLLRQNQELAGEVLTLKASASTSTSTSTAATTPIASSTSQQNGGSTTASTSASPSISDGAGRAEALEQSLKLERGAMQAMSEQSEMIISQLQRELELEREGRATDRSLLTSSASTMKQLKQKCSELQTHLVNRDVTILGLQQTALDSDAAEDGGA